MLSALEKLRENEKRNNPRRNFEAQPVRKIGERQVFRSQIRNFLYFLDPDPSIFFAKIKKKPDFFS
jgi:hypothetical protein